MKKIIQNVQDWLRQEAHVLAGPAFIYEGCSCVPVLPEGAGSAIKPDGFLITQEDQQTRLIAPSPATPEDNLRWESMMMTYLICRTQLAEAQVGLPSEYWYG